MTNRKTTKRALLGSVLALVLCFAMLLGSTYAWFTDKDIATAATIKSGTLDIDLSVLNDNKGWDTNASQIFATKENELWEPGYAVKEVFEIKNKGNLTVQWQARIFAVETINETLAKNITVYYKDYANDEAAAKADSATRVEITGKQNGWVEAGSLYDFINATVASETNPTVGTITKEQGAEYLAIALVMNTTAKNDCQGLTLTNGALTLTIVATQDMDEADDFGNDYDDINIWETNDAGFEVVS